MSLPDDDIPEEIDYLVIGSGFGGSVMAAALAEATKTAGPHPRVCVFERGKAYPPGSFPRTPDDMAKNFWDPSEGLHGLFNVWSFDHMAAVVSSGLGGGSLIYANVMLEKPAEWFTQPHPHGTGEETWSFTRADLDEHYRAIKSFLDVQTMPKEFAAKNSPKTIRFLQGSEGQGRYAPLAVRFRDHKGAPAIGAPLLAEKSYENIFGRPRTTCRLIGECDIGCNEGAKASMDHTYLSKAHSDGASIHPNTEVREIKRLDTDPCYRFEVTYVRHPAWAEGQPRDTKTLALHKIKAKRVILAAGSLGTTFLMLKNREALRVPSTRPVGQRFCGNGDLLGVAEPARKTLNYEASKGPVITAYRRFDDTEDPADPRMFLQDGGVPTIVLWLLKTLDAPGLIARGSENFFKYVWQRIRGSNDNNLSAELSRVLGGSLSFGRGLPILAMGVDVPDGTLSLNRDGILENSWSTESSKPYFAVVRRRMNGLKQRIGAKVQPDAVRRLNQAITVHPLGGCPADTSEFEGVVDSHGRVHGVPGLWIADGSVLPGPVGANPSLTIAAFASRAAEQLLREDLLQPPSPAVPFSRKPLATSTAPEDMS